MATQTSGGNRAASKPAPEPKIEKHAHEANGKRERTEFEEGDGRDGGDERLVDIHAIEEDSTHDVEPSEKAEHPGGNDERSEELTPSEELDEHGSGFKRLDLIAYRTPKLAALGTREREVELSALLNGADIRRESPSGDGLGTGHETRTNRWSSR